MLTPIISDFPARIVANCEPILFACTILCKSDLLSLFLENMADRLSPGLILCSCQTVDRLCMLGVWLALGGGLVSSRGLVESGSFMGCSILVVISGMVSAISSSVEGVGLAEKKA